MQRRVLPAVLALFVFALSACEDGAGPLDPTPTPEPPSPTADVAGTYTGEWSLTVDAYDHHGGWTCAGEVTVTESMDGSFAYEATGENCEPPRDGPIEAALDGTDLSVTLVDGNGEPLNLMEAFMRTCEQVGGDIALTGSVIDDVLSLGQDGEVDCGGDDLSVALGFEGSR